MVQQDFQKTLQIAIKFSENIKNSTYFNKNNHKKPFHR